ncbi:hypothetical protein NFI96_007710 [Prochilodus magdalenae]|nr:hypothetical protein NFI96_007710 [Prochilodus magdalenae]
MTDRIEGCSKIKQEGEGSQQRVAVDNQQERAGKQTMDKKRSNKRHSHKPYLSDGGSVKFGLFRNRSGSSSSLMSTGKHISEVFRNLTGLRRDMHYQSCVSQSISPLEEKVDAVEGQTVTLSCKFDGTRPYLHWYRQYPGSTPEFLLLKYEGSAAVTHAVPRFPRLDVNNSNDIVNLTISSAAVSDSALYYCALQPTVKGNPDTLYRNGCDGAGRSWTCAGQWISMIIYTLLYSSGETSAQTIDPLVGEVQLPEGDDLTLSCNYTTSGYSATLFWYHQSPGSSPEHLLTVVSGSAIRGRLKAEVKDKRVDLKISSAAVSDSALYY